MIPTRPRLERHHHILYSTITNYACAKSSDSSRGAADYHITYLELAELDEPPPADVEPARDVAARICMLASVVDAACDNFGERD